MKKIPLRLQRASHRLVDLLDKAIAEEEHNMHIVVHHKNISRYADQPFYGYDVRINVRYFHGKQKREVTAYRTVSKNTYYNPALRIQDAASEIEKKGLYVKTIGSRRPRKHRCK